MATSDEINDAKIEEILRLLKSKGILNDAEQLTVSTITQSEKERGSK